MALAFYGAAVGAAADNGVLAGLFFPREDLPGINAGELADTQNEAIKQGKFALSFGAKVQEYLADTDNNVLGFSATVGKASINGTTSNMTYTVSAQYVARLDTKSLAVLPVPTTGSNVDEGKVAISALFPSAVDVAAQGAISGEGVLIPYADLTPYGGADPASIASGTDNRDVLGAMVRALPANLTVRTATVASPVITVTTAAPSTVALVAAATDATNPTTGIADDDRDRLGVLSFVTSWTVQILLNQTTQTFDVNSITA